jgi:DNA repair exonuclease SbcCD ATPase subunit
MRIIKLTASNFKKLRAVQIEPNGNIVKITGKNGSGKSSVLDSIVSGLGGRKSSPRKPIREGEEKAVIVVQMDELTVTQKFTAKGSYLEVTNRDGFAAKSPQAVLDKLVGAIAFDPLAFIEKDAREQRQVLIELMGVDLGAHDKKIAALAEHRKGLMQQKKAAEIDLDRMPHHEDVAAEEISVADLVAQLRQANAANKEFDALKEKADAKMKELVALHEEKARLNARITEVERALQDLQEGFVDMKRIDTAEIEKQATEIEQTNRKVRDNQQHAKAQAGIDRLAEQVNADYQTMKQAEADKANALAAVRMPLDGLSVDEGGILYDGIPLEQVNHAKQLEVSVAIQMALNPKLKVMLINGNGLDSTTMETVTRMASDKDYQLWIEQADETGKVGVYISDGSVVSIDGLPVNEIATV